MAVICGFLIWAINLLSFDPFINLAVNCLLIVILIIYLMQFLGIVKGILPPSRSK
ncbi:hypothetical protein [Legionella cardiaca]|uniref:hypothetical protein n=1 Tax=Legionella cardiaca TaxID=1071983 RepID=UPI003B849005